MVGGTRRVPRWWLASRSETHTLGLERVKEAFPFNAEFPATSDPPELRTFQSGVRARSSTFLAGGSSPGDQLFESRAFRKSESPRPHRPTCRSTPECSPASANETASALQSLLAAGANIGVANERHVLDLLKAHYAYQHPVLLEAPEHNTLIDFVPQFLPGHIRFGPAICGDDPFISLRAIVDNGPSHLKIAVVAAADHEYSASFSKVESRRGRVQYLGLWSDGPNDVELVRNRGRKPLNIRGRRTMQRFRDDQGGSGFIPNGRIAALPIRPSPGVRSPGAVRENDFMSFGILCFTGEGQINFRAARISDFDVLRNPGNVEHGHRNCEGN